MKPEPEIITRFPHGSAVDRSLPVVEPDTDHVESLASQMASEWALGRPLATETYLRENPRLCERPSIAVRLIYEEICLREKAGNPIGWEELSQRFPLWISEIQMLVEFHSLIVPRLEPPRFPAIGEVLDGSLILRQIGQGGASRVYLVQDTLDRKHQSVWKLGSGLAQERSCIKLFDHPFIMPLQSALEFPERNIHALSMPDLGGVSLGEILDRLRSKSGRSRDGRALVAALSGKLQAGPRREILRRSRWPDVVAWIGTCLAGALSHIHGHNLVHFDVKPSNILISGRWIPMLLDFHLTRQPVTLGSVDLDMLGGTPGYMSPEQEDDIEAARELRPAPRRLDGRSDFFSLGRVLLEALGAEVPAIARADYRVILEKIDPLDSTLMNIILRCLETEPESRYETASDLLEELRSRLSGHPLLKLVDLDISSYISTALHEKPGDSIS